MPLTLDNVCKSININRCYLSDILKKQVKCTFSQYILKQRISLSKKLLKDSSLTINIIAEKCGFTNHSYFCTCFKIAKKYVAILDDFSIDKSVLQL